VISTVSVVEESGFCCGVRAAVHKAEEFFATEKTVYLYGDLVNNRRVMKRFCDGGFIVTEQAAEIPPGSTVIIRAHGVARSVYEALSHTKIIDCTCAKVKKIHNIGVRCAPNTGDTCTNPSILTKPETICDAKESARRVIVIGKKNHPEVAGILGWCDNGMVAENENELRTALDTAGELSVVGQTTCGVNWWEQATAIVREIAPTAEIFNTLCDVTSRRTKNAVNAAQNADYMIVVGDKKSANSTELYEACKKANPNTFFASGAEDLPEISRGNITIAGSASTPAEVIEEIHNTLLFANFLACAKTEIDTASDKYFANLQRSATSPVISAAINDLAHQHQHGKRIRGALILLGANIGVKGRSPFQGFGDSVPEVLSLSLAYEIFATAILIHDDIIDKSEIRRGKKTIHALENDPHFGLSRAICIGDYGLFLANKILASAGFEADVLAKILTLFAEIQLTTLDGELMDVSLPTSPINPAENYDEYIKDVRKIYESKTAWYTLAGPLLLGAICGGADENLLDTLKEIGLPLGLAFQIKDDLLGIFASEEKLGKPALSDIIEKKQTTLYGFACKNASPAQRKALAKSYGNPYATEADLYAVREIFTQTGAKAAAEAEIAALSRAALHASKKLPIEHKPLLCGLIHYLCGRTK